MLHEMAGDVDGVVITGVYGSGKSTVAARSPSSSNGGHPYAAIDLDWLTWFETPDLGDDTSERIFLENLACVVGNYLAAGVRHFVLAGAVRDGWPSTTWPPRSPCRCASCASTRRST